MELFQQKKTIDLAYDLFVRGRADVSRIPYIPSKTVLCDKVSDSLPRATPESRGIDSRHLQAMLSDLEHNRSVNLHSITVLVDGAVVCEASAPGYDRQIPHISHSMCKSLVGLAIGMLWDEGCLSLDTPAYTLFPANRLPTRLSARTKAITVEHLLTMSSGVSFAETGAVTESDWVRAFFAADLKFDPGSDFGYNSMNTYILSAIVREISGMGLCEYLHPRLFAPLGITQYVWETCPAGTEKGGWGLYMAAEDAAKIGELCRLGGMHAGRRLISEAWLSRSCTTQRKTPESTGAFHYGYQMWTARNGGSFLFNGMLGQNIWVYPRNRVVVVTYAGNVEFFQQSAMLSILMQYLGGDGVRHEKPLPRCRRAERALHRTEEEFFATRSWIDPHPMPSFWTRLWRALCGRPRRPLPKLCAHLAGKTYRFGPNNHGILPLFMRLMQNNHTAGLHGVQFLQEGERFFLLFDEGEDECYRIEASFYGYREGALTVRGEHYRIASAAAFAVDEDGRRLLKLDILLPECSHARRIKIYFDEDRPTLVMREVPGKEIVTGLIQCLPAASPRMRGILQFIGRRLNFDYFLMKAYDKFEPSLAALLPGEKTPAETAGLDKANL